MSELFDPPAPWRRLPDRYRNARRIGTLLSGLVGTAILTVPAWLFLGWGWGVVALVGCLAFTSWRLVRVDRWVRNFGYAEREADLIITKGLWYQSLTAIPYGRMLAVNVSSGPIDRALGLASIQLVTASSQSDAIIPGLSQDEAASLRDRLIAAGESQALPL